VRDDLLRERLLDRNPWWRAAAAHSDPVAWAKTDQALRSRAVFDLGYRSDLLGDVATGTVDDKLVVLRGARRVGKSVLLKDTAAQLCGRPDIDPRQLVYVPTDGMRAADLNRVVKLGRELTRSAGDVPRVWLLDEVTGIKGWTQTLKYLRDNTEFGTDTVVCTGSSWDEEAEVERDLLAGRAGQSSTRRSRILHPMSFRDVLATTDRRVSPPARLRPWELQDEAARVAAESLEFFVDEIDLAWQAYLTSGGFPRAVAEYHRTGSVSEAFLRDLAAWLHRDIDPDADDDSVPKLLSGYGSRRGLDLRLTRLVRTYAAIWSHQIDDDARQIAGSQPKLYLCDPVLAWLGPRLRSGLPLPNFTRLTEACIGAALARVVDDLQPGRWENGDSIGYLRTGGGNEIDFGPVTVPSPAGPVKTVPIESKWVSSGWRAEAKTIEGRFAIGIVATRSILDVSHRAWAFPAPIVALLLL